MFDMPKKIAMGMIRFYQRGISPFFGARCRFVPTCSAYTYEAIKIHGVLKGITLGIIRISKCHPFHEPMYDPVPQKKEKKHKNKST
ncbi:MAG: membrane protein insertion efficiency factor YidD [Cellulosilyticaceae bacterium]